ncbi:MAG: ArsR family transcriptional regulator [Acidobacteria bacterium]|nr:MAG: ArsR family transcriptional regulator [Acidobacteriota bacterium]
MDPELIDHTGLCRASICSAAEIRAIRRQLAASETELAATLRWLEAIKDPTRFKLVYLLWRYQRLCVCDLANVLGVTSSAVSQHLRRLKDLQLVATSRVKQTIFYSLDNADFVAFFERLNGSSDDGAGRELRAAGA